MSGSARVITLEADGEAAALAVRDTGVGIRPEELPRIFERFYRHEKSNGTAMTSPRPEEPEPPASPGTHAAGSASENAPERSEALEAELAALEAMLPPEPAAAVVPPAEAQAPDRPGGSAERSDRDPGS